METIDILDVTKIEPRLKHPTIFEKFDSLEPAQAFVIHNDHDPKPLYYQLLGERGQIFSWEYLESGPEIWQVKIAKNPANAQEETIGQMVAGDYRKAQVFKKLGIDFCCGGKRTIEEACRTKGLDPAEVKTELAQINPMDQNPAQNFDKWKLDFLADYIVNTHHEYVRTNVPFITELANKVARVHGSAHPEMTEVAQIFDNVGKDLILHLAKEENIVFPFIRQLVQDNAGKETAASFPGLGSISSPVQIMEAEHEQAGEDLEKIRTLTQNYTLPEDACASYTVLFSKLQEFENDLFNHVHLENNILFPRAIELERNSK